MTNLIHVTTPSGWNGDSLVALANVIALWDLDSYSLLRERDFYLTSLYVRDIAVQDGEAYGLFLGNTHSGFLQGQVMPAQCSKCIKLITTQSGRSYRGRFFTTPPMQSQIVDYSVININTVNAYCASLIQLIVSLHEATPYMALAVVSYRHNKQWRTVADVRPVENAVAVDNRMDTQRRRLGRAIGINPS